MKKYLSLLLVSILGISCYAQRSMWHSICVYGDTVETYLCSSIDSISYSVDDEDAILQNIWNQNLSIKERIASVDSILFYNPYTENIVKIDEGTNLWDKAYVTPIGYFRYKSSMPFIEEEDKDEFEVLSYVSFDEKESAYMVFDKTTHLPLCLYMDSIAVHMDYLADSLCAFTIVDKSGVTADWEFEFSKTDVDASFWASDNELKTCLGTLMSVLGKGNTMDFREWIDITTDYLVNADLSSEDGWTNKGIVDHYAESNRFLAFYSGWGSLEYTNASLTQNVKLPAGKYRLEGKAYFRQGERFEDYPTTSLGYMIAGDNKVQVPTLASEDIASSIVDIASAASAFYDSNNYSCSLEFTLQADANIAIGYECTFNLMRSWMGLGAMSIAQESVTEATNCKEVTEILELFQPLANLEIVDYLSSSLALPRIDEEFVFALSSANDSKSISSTYYPVYVVTRDSYNTTSSSATLVGAIRSVNTIYTKQGVYGIICDENSDSLSLDAADYILYDSAMNASFNYSIDCQGMKPATEYFYRAFYVGDEVNEYAKPDILYGNVLSFSTLSPIVKTGDCIEVTDRSATIECFYDDIPSNATCGVVLSWDGGERSVTSDDSINALKSYNISKLIPATKYSYQAFVEVGDTTFYGVNRTFTTKKLDMTGRWAFKYSGNSYIVDFYADGTTSKYDGVHYFRWTVNGGELELNEKDDYPIYGGSPWIEYRGTFDEDLVSVSGNGYCCDHIGTNYNYVEDVLGEFTLNKYIVSTGKCLEYDLNSATVQCYYENVPEGAECGIILSWDEGVDTIPSSSEEATKVFVLNNLTSFKTYTYCGYIKYGGKIYTGGNKTFMPKHPVIPDLSGTWVFDQSFYWVKTVNLEFVKSGDGRVEYKYSEGSSSLTCTIYADQKVTINIYISGGYSSRATFEGVTNETFTSFSGDSYSTSSSNGVNVRVDTVNEPWVFCRP